MENEKTKNNKKSFGSGFVCGFLCSIFVVLAGFGAQSLFESIQEKDILYDINQYFNRRSEKSGSTSVLNESSIAKLEKIESIIHNNFYRPELFNQDDLEEGLYRGLLDALDDRYAEYYSAQELELTQNRLAGVFFGIGVMVAYDEEKRLTVISEVIEGGAASESDIREGDFIVAVDDFDVSGFSTDEVVNLIRGEESTAVKITVFREGSTDFISFDLTRRRMTGRSNVRYGLTDDISIGYIRMREFDATTPKQFDEALEELRGHNIKGLIIDLRSNHGGSLTSVVNVARSILPEGLIVYTEDRHGNREEYLSDGKNSLGIPLTVLVNEYSASAAEILAGAIQDHGVGTIIGEATFGKGEVQNLFFLSDGSAVKLTVSSYFTPLGRDLGNVGVIPDVVLPLDRHALHDDGIDNQVEWAMEVLRGKQ
ncbi:MAG: S41 family peptidase [Lachnospiraceae bacterium]|nr:S41 family peptidase [Lachnospiraceae bacterium]